MVTPALDTLRISLHILGVTVWVGGQLTLLGLLPVVRAAGGDVPRQAARQFNRIAWPAFAVAVVTGVWNLAEAETGEGTTWDMVLFAKLVVVAISGIGAFLHTQAQTPAARGITGAAGFLAGLGALVLGVMLSGQ